jgi:hypothetical protein
MTDAVVEAPASSSQIESVARRSAQLRAPSAPRPADKEEDLLGLDVPM